MAGVSGGTAAIFAAKLVFLVAGYVLYAALGRLLSTEEFGVYGVVFGVVSAVNMVLINGTLQTVSRFVATAPQAAAAARWRALRFQLVVAALIVGTFVLGAPQVAAALNDPSLTPHLRLGSVIMLAYALYAVNVGYLNGRQRFAQQAALDTGFSLLRIGGIIGAVAWLGGVQAAIGGFAAAAVLVLLISFPVAGFGAGGEPAAFSFRAFSTFTVSLMSAAFLQNLLLTTDLFFLKSLSDPAQADTLAGLYTAAQSIARIPYYLMATASLVLFPLIARLSAGADAAQRASTSSQGLSAVVALVAGIPALTAPIAEPVVRVLYPERYAGAALPLALLVAAMSLMAVANVCVTMLGGGGRPVAAAGILGAALAVQAAVAGALVPSRGMEGAGLATVAGAALAVGASGVALHRWFGTVISARVAVVVTLGVVLAAGAATTFAHLWPAPPKLVVIAFLAAGYGLYLAVLLLGGVLFGDPGTRPQRVLWVTKPLVPPFNDASKVFPAALARHVDAGSVAVCVTRGAAGPDGGWPEGVESLPLYRSGGSFSGRLGQNLWLLSQLFLRRFRYRALHFFFTPSSSTALAARLLKWVSPGVAFYQTVTSAPRLGADLGRLGFGDVLVCGSQGTLARFAPHLPAARLLLARPGVDAAALPQTPDRAWQGGPPGPTRRDWYAARGLDPAHFHLLFAGDLEHGRAEEHLRAVMARLRRDETPCTFHLSVRRKSAASQAAAERLLAAVTPEWDGRLRVYWDHAPFAELLELQDAMVFPAESLEAKMDAPLVILETLGRGKPVFCLDRSPLDEIPDSAQRELLLAPDPEGLAARIAAYARQPSSLPAAALRATVVEKFDIRRTAALYQALYTAGARPA